jgi:hypothetical protein
VSSRRAAARSTGLVVDDRRPRRTPAHDSIRRAHPLSKHRVGHECCGSPFAPFEPTRRVSNVIWGGGRLADILADCWLRTGARYIWSYGADFGEFGSAVVDAYVKDLPLSRVGADVLIAYEMNSGSLLPEHGFPARLVAPRILRNPVCESPARSQFGRPSIIASSTNTAATPIVTLPSPPERQRTQAADTGGARWPIED